MPQLHNGEGSFGAYFWNRVRKTDSCWLWFGYTNEDGYGRLYFNRRLTLAHRVSLALLGISIPNNMEVDHLCRTRNCVNPEHLDIVLHQINMKRGISRCAKKTHCKSGHSLTGMNLLIRGESRQCRVCVNARKRSYDQIKRDKSKGINNE